MKKIVLIGSGGSGKSTLARKLGEKLDIEVHHLDALFWKRNWVPTPKDEQKRIQMDLVEREQWIIDGNYNGTMDLRLNAADTIIFLDFNRVLCTCRVLKRMIQYRNRKRPDMGEGVKERFDPGFIRWVWKYPERNRPIVMEKLKKLPADRTITILRSPKEVRQFLENL